MGDGEPQVKASILSDKAAPGGGAGAPKLGDPPNLPVTIGQFQVKPQEERTDTRGGTEVPARQRATLAENGSSSWAGWHACGGLATW